MSVQAVVRGEWWSDVRFALRNAAKRPGFTILVTLTLALGLGVNSAVFALVDAALLRPLPYRDPSRLVFAWQTLERDSVYDIEGTPFDYDAWHRVRGLSELAMIQYGSFTLTGGDGAPERVNGARITASLMPLIGITPAIGRRFVASEDRESAPATVILSDGLWRRRYGADPAIIGRDVQIDGTPQTVVGILPRGAALPARLAIDDQLWLPMRMSPAEQTNEQAHSYTVVGRLADGVSLSHASAEIQTLAGQLADHATHRGLGARLVPVTEQTVRTLRPALVVAACGVALLLLIATANATTLLIARASNRRHELAVRAALGATRWRLLWASLTESLLFAGLGGAAGLGFANWVLRAILPLFAGSLPPTMTVDVNGRAAAFTAAISFGIGVVFGALASHRPSDRLVEVLGSSTRLTAAPRSMRIRQMLVIAQIALAVVLLSAAGLMLNSVAKLSRVRPGFDPDGVLTFKIALTGPRYVDAPARVATISALLEDIRATAGVRSAAVTSLVPFSGQRRANTAQIEGRVRAAGELSMIIDQRYISPGYFQTMRVPVLTGRDVTADDDSRSEPVTLINRRMAERYFANEDPINRRVRTEAGFDSGVWFRVIGVVDDMRHISLDRDAVPEMYRPIAQTAIPLVMMAVRTEGNPARMASALRAAVQRVDSGLPIADVRTMNDRIAASFAQTRGTMLLLLVTAVFSSLLAAVAVYGSIWYSVVQEIPAIAICVALGASRASVFRHVVMRALVMAAIGAGLGVTVALASGSLLRALLFETQPTDAFTYLLVVGGVLAVAGGASVVPAVRAMRVDPLTALRAS